MPLVLWWWFVSYASVFNSNIVSATTSNSASDVYSWLASIRMASGYVTCGERMGGDNGRLTSAVEPTCGRVKATEEVVLLERN